MCLTYSEPKRDAPFQVLMYSFFRARRARYKMPAIQLLVDSPKLMIKRQLDLIVVRLKL